MASGPRWTHIEKEKIAYLHIPLIGKQLTQEMW